MKRRDLMVGLGLAASAMPPLGKASEGEKGGGYEDSHSTYFLCHNVYVLQ